MALKTSQIHEALRQFRLLDDAILVADVQTILWIHENPGRPQKDLAAALGFTAPRASRVLARLAARYSPTRGGLDLVEVSQGPDNRTLSLRLTPRGKALVLRALQIPT